MRQLLEPRIIFEMILVERGKNRAKRDTPNIYYFFALFLNYVKDKVWKTEKP